MQPNGFFMLSPGAPARTGRGGESPWQSPLHLAAIAEAVSRCSLCGPVSSPEDCRGAGAALASGPIVWNKTER